MPTALSFSFVFLILAWTARAQISPDEQELLDALDPTAVVSLTRRLSEEVGVGSSGAGYGSAIAGSPAEKALADFTEKEMRARGFDVVRERFPVRSYDYGEVKLLVNGSEVEAITLHSSTGTWGVRDGVEYANGNEDAGRMIRAKLLDAGRGLAADYDRIGDVAGEVVLVRRSVWPSATALEAAVRGARAVVFYDYPGENPDDALKQDGIQYHDKIPAVSISKRDAARILEKLAEGKIEDAEAYMESRRLVFLQHGYLLRKINQAYFAFYGAYADVPGGAAGEDPVGPAVRALREQSASLADFINRISWMTSFEQLQEATAH